MIGQVGAGLHALHQRGVLHRDVKPANVLFRTVELDGRDAGQRDARRPRPGQGDGHVVAADHDRRHAPVRRARAGAGRGARRPGRPVLPGRPDLPAARRPRAVRPHVPDGSRRPGAGGTDGRRAAGGGRGRRAPGPGRRPRRALPRRPGVRRRAHGGARLDVRRRRRRPHRLDPSRSRTDGSVGAAVRVRRGRRPRGRDRDRPRVAPPVGAGRGGRPRARTRRRLRGGARADH